MKEEEFHQLQLEQQQMVYEALDKCHEAGAPDDELKFLAWQAGCGDWKPTPIRRH
jgi:hypothetical protein